MIKGVRLSAGKSNSMKRFPLFFFTMALFILAIGNARCFGYQGVGIASLIIRPDETAFDKADVIAIAHNLLSAAGPDLKQASFFPVIVDKCWKGDCKTGDRILLDNSLSSPNCSFYQPLNSIVYLKEMNPNGADSADHIQTEKTFSLLGMTALETLDVDRCYNGLGFNGPPLPAAVVKQSNDALMRVLDASFKNKPANMADFGRKVLVEDTNPFLLIYAAWLLPKPLSAADADLLVRTILRLPEESYLKNEIHRVLHKDQYRLDGPTLLTLFECGGPSGSLSLLIDADNIKAIQKQLFRRLSDPEDRYYADGIFLSLMARFAPDFVKQELRSRPFPFDIEIPLFSWLHINGSDIGRPDYPQQALNAAVQAILIGNMLHGSISPLASKTYLEHMLGPNADPKEVEKWKAAAPFMSPLLSSPDDKVRIQTAEFLRALGYTVNQDGKNYKLVPKPATEPLP
jgi:hypothetical protein